jgi:hypothetical protein
LLDQDLDLCGARDQKVDLKYQTISRYMYIPEIPCQISSEEVRGYDIWNQEEVKSTAKLGNHMYIMELRLLECCRHPDRNLEYPQLQAHFNIERIGRDECNVCPGHCLAR